MSSSPANSAQQLQNAPALKPPPGVRPNFVNPPSYESTIVALEGVFLALMLIALSVRVYVRTRITKSIGWDDYTCIVAACGSLAHMIDYVEMFKVGFGRHLWDIRALELLNVHNSRLLSSNGVVYAFTICFAKLSILLLYLRIFKLERGMRLAVYAGIGFITIYYTAIIGVAIGSIVKCNGLGQMSSRFCKNYAKPVVVMNAVINVVTDLYVLALPIPSVLKLQLNPKRRFGLLLVFASGIVTCAASLTRMIIFCIHYKDRDVLWIQGRNAQFTVVEINIAIIVACASTFPTFFSKTKVIGSDVYLFLRSRVLSTTASRTGAGSGASSGGGGIAARERKRSDGGSSADTLQMHGDRTRLRGGNEEVGGSYEMEAPERENMVSIVGKGNERSFV